MKILAGQNCKHYIDYDVIGDYVFEPNIEDNNIISDSSDSNYVLTNEENSNNKMDTKNNTNLNFQKYTIKSVNISSIRIDDLVDYCYEILDPKNNLNNPVIRQTFEVLDQKKKREIGRRMLIYRYCIHRILTLNKIYKPENWIFKTMNDYYGEEVDIICLKPKVSEKVDLELLCLSGKNESKKMEYILELEYGHLIPTVINKNWDIVQIDQSQLIFSNQKHFEQCQSETKTKYLETYKLPRGVVSKQGDTGKYKVVDGYHRLCSVSPDQKFLVIYCESSKF